jgi:serine protease AprX
MRYLFIILSLLAATTPLLAQTKYRWLVEFKDKANSPYCTCRPAEFLSARSLERRAKCNIPILEEDLPANPLYIKELRKQKKVEYYYASRWLNAAVVASDKKTIDKVRKLKFVKKVTQLGIEQPRRNPKNRPVRTRVSAPNPKEGAKMGEMGFGLRNVAPMRSQFLYLMGARGEGIWVAVMDGGFSLVDSLNLFDSLALQGRLWTGPDFVEGDRGVFESSPHGTSVLSVMGANAPEHFVGIAPKATYFLLKTEESGYESPFEEANWVVGAEWADSIGVDIINASLGYTHFNDSTLNYTYATLDGKTALSSRGAAIAARKGMIICNAAGNAGDEPWKHINTPADAIGVIAVGATNAKNSKYAYFSSVGPTPDGRIKPDLAAPGLEVIGAGLGKYKLEATAGTSIASPILAGSLASLWSAYPEKTDQEILNAVFASTDRKHNPDAKLGYGQPDFATAWLLLGGFNTSQKNIQYGFHDKAIGKTLLLFEKKVQHNGTEAVLYNCMKQRVWSGPLQVKGQQLKTIQIEALDTLPSGVYYLNINGNWWMIGS